jgi:glycosyltransferase involved in cell wall biosynthesis
MPNIIIADMTGRYDGRDLESGTLGGTEASVIRCARELARRGHDVNVYTNCDTPVRHEEVSWFPLNGTRPDSCDLYVAVHQPRLLGFVRRPKRRAIWVLWPASQLNHYKKIWRMWLYRPVPILISQYQLSCYSFLPRRGLVLIPLGLPEDVRGFPPRANTPSPRAIFASNPQRNLRRLVELWLQLILPRVPDAVLEVYGLNNLRPNEDAWKLWEGSLLPIGVPENLKRSVCIYPSVRRPQLIEAMRKARVMLYLGHKCEAFCLSLAEAQALGLPAVVAPVAALPERVIDQVTGFHHSDPERFAQAAVSLLTNDSVWQQQHQAALRHQQGITWVEHAERLERAFLKA